MLDKIYQILKKKKYPTHGRPLNLSRFADNCTDTKEKNKIIPYMGDTNTKNLKKKRSCHWSPVTGPPLYSASAAMKERNIEVISS